MLLLCALIAGGSSAWADDTWEKTAPASLNTGDIIVVVDQTSSKAMSNDNGTSSAPSATDVTLSADKSQITSIVATTLQWTLTTSDTGGSRTYQLANGNNYLYVTKSNNGVRVGSGERNTFTIVTGGDNKGYYLYNKNGSDERYIGCYNSSDWRCYGTINANIKGNNIAFYKKTTATPVDPSTPNAIVSVTSLAFGSVDAGTTKDLTFTVTPSNLTGNLTISCDNDAKYEVTPTSIEKSTTTATTITVTAKPTVIAEDMSGTITISGGGITPKTVTLTCTSADPDANDGSESKPFTVAEVINGTAKGSGVYVKGYILGAVDGTTGALKTVSESNDIDTNLAIGDTPTETENYCTVQLKGAIREALKTKNQTYNIGVAQILVKGNIEKYCGKPGVKDLTEGSKVGEYVAISSAGMATYYTDCALDFTGYDDMYAYVAAVEGDKVNFTRVMKVPAKTAVVLRNPSMSEATHTVPVATSPEDVTSAMTGTLIRIEELATTDGSNTNYILNTGAQGVGFYWANGSSVGVHKAYLSVGAGARAFIGFDDDATGIQQMERNAQNNDSIFNLAGQRVAQPTKGLYIVNGKKVIIK